MALNILSGSQRGTGRTTRMLQQAIAAAEDGHRVVIVAASFMQRRSLEARINAQAPWAQIELVTPSGDPGVLFDWLTLQFSARGDVRTFVDHYAIENAAGPLLEEYHRYDREA